MSERRVGLFALLAVLCTLGAAAAVVLAAGGSNAPAGSPDAAAEALSAARRQQRPVVVMRTLDRADPAASGRVAVAGLDRGAPERVLAPLRCDRVAFGPRNGLCLARADGFAGGYEARVLGPDLRVQHTLGVAGTPSRARVSADGRYGSVTLFVTGHAYADAGAFSTQTTLIDLARGTKVGELEDFTTFRGSEQVTALDVNFWGVTFAPDSDRFYATLATGGKTYLVEGSVRDRTMRTLHENVECPSLSPDATRVAYKKRVGSGAAPWRLTILDLRTMRETPLSETRSVDDQVAWLDDRRVLYGLDGQVWAADADGGGRPAPFARGADSPTVVRWTSNAPPA